jgi:hypothetical protein
VIIDVLFSVANDSMVDDVEFEKVDCVLGTEVEANVDDRPEEREVLTVEVDEWLL